MTKQNVYDEESRHTYSRWKYHSGYIVEHGRRYVGAAVRDGNLWGIAVGYRDTGKMRYATLRHATKEIIREDRRRVSLARALGGKS